MYFNVKGEIRYGRWENGKRKQWISQKDYEMGMKLRKQY